MVVPPKKNSFGVRTLLILTTITAFGIVGGEFFFNNSKYATTTLLLFASSVVIGFSAIGYSMLVASYVAIGRISPQARKRHLRTCLQLFLFGLFVSLLAFALIFMVAMR